MDLKETVSNSKNLAELLTNLEAQGQTYKSQKEFFTTIENDWYNEIYDEKIHPLYLTKISKPELAATIQTQHNTYNIHGIVHGNIKALACGWHPRKKVIEYISDQFCEYAQQDDLNFAEEGLESSFHLPNTTEIKDHIQPNGEHESETEISRGLYNLLYITDIFRIAWGWTYFPLKAGAAKLGITHSETTVEQNALCEPTYIKTARDLTNAAKLPEPLELEKDHFLEQMKVENKIKKTIKELPQECTSAQRSLYMAQELLKRTKDYKDKNVHLLCGAQHETEVAYFLKHPNYSFAALEEQFLMK